MLYSYRFLFPICFFSAARIWDSYLFLRTTNGKMEFDAQHRRLESLFTTCLEKIESCIHRLDTRTNEEDEEKFCDAILSENLTPEELDDARRIKTLDSILEKFAELDVVKLDLSKVVSHVSAVRQRIASRKDEETNWELLGK